jgi:hypothetical protein
LGLLIVPRDVISGCQLWLEFRQFVDHGGGEILNGDCCLFQPVPRLPWPKKIDGTRLKIRSLLLLGWSESIKSCRCLLLQLEAAILAVLRSYVS